MNELANILYGIDVKQGITKFGSNYISVKYRSVKKASEIDFKHWQFPKAGPSNFIIFYDDKALTFTYQNFFYCSAREKGDKKVDSFKFGKQVFKRINETPAKMITAFGRGKLGFRVKITKKGKLQFLYFRYDKGSKKPSKYYNLTSTAFTEMLHQQLDKLLYEHFYSIAHVYVQLHDTEPEHIQGYKIIKELILNTINANINKLEVKANEYKSISDLSGTT